MTPTTKSRCVVEVYEKLGSLLMLDCVAPHDNQVRGQGYVLI